MRKKSKPISLKNISIAGKFWSPLLQKIREITIPYEWEALNDRIPGAPKSGAVFNYKVAAGKEKGNFYGCPFQDSDLAKWLEAVAYVLANKPDKKLEEIADQMIDLIGEAQDENGYVVTRYLMQDKDKRWTNIRDNHELYVMGHLLEAAVAYYEATGKRKFLDIMIRAVEHIAEVFGTKEGQLRGYPGHEEIELALIKLYRITGIERYLDLCKYFIEERGRQPYFFVEEAITRGANPLGPWGTGTQDYWQAHLPVREQTTAEGHAVRAMYLYAAMADLAHETDDKTLFDACEKLWQNIVNKRMYVTGSVGSSYNGETFTFDYDLPNESAYAETCAAIGLVFFAQRMLFLNADRKYADIMERALYNGVLSGIATDGKHFFYVNPLASFPGNKKPGATQRKRWYDCACCPPNIARLFSSLGRYCYSMNEDTFYVHLYTGGKTIFHIDDQPVVLEMETDYPWQEEISLSISTQKPVSFTLAIRIPGWCQNARLEINGVEEKIENIMKNGYAQLKRNWSNKDRIVLTLPMPVERMESHPKVRTNAGRVALQRGPVVYCFEEVDNGKDLNDNILPESAAVEVTWEPGLFDGIPVIIAEGKKRDQSGWENELYRAASSNLISTRIKAIPYFLWANRREGEMLVWIRQV